MRCWDDVASWVEGLNGGCGLFHQSQWKLLDSTSYNYLYRYRFCSSALDQSPSIASPRLFEHPPCLSKQSKLPSYTARRTCASYVTKCRTLYPQIKGERKPRQPNAKADPFEFQEERSLQAPSTDEVQIAVQSTGLCGSDLHYFGHFRNGDILVREPLTLGHESSGTVVAVGSGVSNLKPGDRVALEVGLPCESCEYCDSGRYNICRGMKFRSSAKAFPHMQGTLQERINHPARWVHKYVSTASSFTVSIFMNAYPGRECAYAWDATR